MPTIEVSRSDLKRLVGKSFNLEKIAGWIKAEINVDEKDKDLIHVELKDVNRPDLFSAEGIAREIKLKLGIPFSYEIRKGNYVLKVNPKVKKVRPLIACSVVKNVKLDEKAIFQLIQLQEKLCENFGLKRKEAAIGIYDFDKIRWPVTYTTFKPDSISFVPLGFNKEMTLKEILQNHEKGKQYGHLIENAKEWPILIDSEKHILSMPPIINSEYSGKVTEKTRNVFVEVTGFEKRFVFPCLMIMTLALAERKGKIETVKVKSRFKSMETPETKKKQITVSKQEIEEVLGLKLKEKEIEKLLRKSGFEVKKKGKTLTLEIPYWRQDIMDARDVAEDVAITYGYNNFKAEQPTVISFGKLSRESEFKKKVANMLIGFEAQEITTFMLVSSDVFKKARVKVQALEIANPISSNYKFLRTMLFPSLLEFFSLNKNARYPQRIFEIGKVIEIEKDKRNKQKAIEKEKLCFAISNSRTTFTEIKQVLDHFLSSLGIVYELEETEHKSFIEGRVANIKIKNEVAGIIGEIHPAVLEKFNIVMPTALFEISLDKLLKQR